MVYCGIYPADGAHYDDLKDALERLRLNDASLFFEPETSIALGYGYRCGFLGLLHMEIIQQRLEREFDLDLVTTAPNVVYRVETTSGEVLMIDNPANLPDQSHDSQDAGAVRVGQRVHAAGLCRRDNGAVPGKARRVQGHEVHRGLGACS